MALGRSLKFLWFVGQLRSTRKARANSAKSLGKLGNVRAVDPLIRVLEDNDPYVQAAAIKALGELGDSRAVEPLVAALEHWSLRYEAASALGRLGPESVEPLIAALWNADSNVRDAAAFALGESRDSRAVEPLIAALKDSNRSVRKRAARSLGRIDDSRTLEPLIAMLTDSDMQRVAAEALKEAGWESADATLRVLHAIYDGNIDGCVREGAAVGFRPVKGALRSTDSYVRNTAAMALFELEGIDALIAVLKDPDRNARAAAEHALTYLHASRNLQDSRAVELLITALKDPSNSLRAAAARVLVQVSPTLSVDPLIAMLRDPHHHVRAWVADSLRYLRSPRAVERAVKPLVTALNDNSYDVRKAAASALVQLAPESIVPLIAVLMDADSDVQKSAADSLESATRAPGQIKGTSILAPLIAMLRNPDMQQVAAEVFKAGGLESADVTLRFLHTLYETNYTLYETNYDESKVRQLARKGGTLAINPLIAALRSTNRSVRKAAAQALGELSDARAIDPLIRVLMEEEPSVAARAARALGELGDASAIDPLIRVLKEEDPSVAAAAAHALGELGDARAVDPLIRILKEKEPSVAAAAARALGELADARAVDQLIELLKHGDDFSQSQAALALGRLGDVRAVEPLVALLDDSSRRVSSLEAFYKPDRLTIALREILESASPYVSTENLRAIAALSDFELSYSDHSTWDDATTRISLSDVRQLARQELTRRQ